jgi:glutamyl-tRNA reductase
VVNENIADRQREAMRAEAIVEEEVEKFLERLNSRNAAPLVRALQRRADNLRQAELQRMRHRLGPLTPEQEQTLEALTRGLMQKWLHHPMVALRHAAAEEDGAPLLDAAERIFGIQATDSIEDRAGNEDE